VGVLTGLNQLPPNLVQLVGADIESSIQSIPKCFAYPVPLTLRGHKVIIVSDSGLDLGKPHAPYLPFGMSNSSSAEEQDPALSHKKKK
jgi:hypothetical protein